MYVSLSGIKVGVVIGPARGTPADVCRRLTIISEKRSEKKNTGPYVLSHVFVVKFMSFICSFFNLIS